MSHIYEALKQAGLERPKAQKPEVPPERPVEVKQVSAVPQTKKPSARGSTSLFQPNPDENFRLWMQEYFPDASLSREEAIRQFLARPPESRIQSLVDNNESIDKPLKEKPTVAMKEPANGSRAVPSSVNKAERRSAWSPKLTTSAARNFRLGRQLGKWLVAVVVCLAAGLGIVKFLSATPIREVLKHVAAPDPAIQSRTPLPVPTAAVPLSENHSVTQRRSEKETASGHIEGLSIGCAQTQPCIRIDTLGDVATPKLSVLAHPDRLVIDFQGVSYFPTSRLLTVDRGSVKDVRVGTDQKNSPSNTRIVIDLLEKCRYDLRTFTDTFVLNVYPDQTNAQSE